LREAGPDAEQAALEGDHSAISDASLLVAWEVVASAQAVGAKKAMPVGVAGDDNVNH
jgi:hypothetical protein